MSNAAIKTAADILLPPSVLSRLDVSRLLSEVEQIDNSMTAAVVRAKAGAPAQPLPLTSQLLQDFLELNTIQLDTAAQRTQLLTVLKQLKDTVPVLHMTFAVPAERESLQQLTQWVRQSIHPQAVIAVGLQPALVAGVYLRTPNHVHDLSLRALLAGSHGVLVKELEALRAGK